jgi:nitroimidazol reductase NimA-like FMN-containing flavoprotein (pyridoxamine 5'-phosphate oxidase superfamily)
MDVEKIVREYIDKSIHISLGTCRDNKPWVCELHFVYDDQLNLYFRSLKTSRHSQDIAQNPKVAGNIVRQHKVDDYPHAIYFEGTAEIVDDEQECLELLPLFKTRLNALNSILEEAKREDGHQFYKVTVENWFAFGKFGQDFEQKYELTWNGGKNE